MKNLPNILTLERILVLPFFVIGVYVDTYTVRVILLVLYIFSSIFDFFDGYIARNYNMSSNFGRIFDPIADKSLVIIILLTVCVRDPSAGKFILIPFSIIVLRELVISGLRESLSANNIVVKVSKLGKYKTTCQILAVGFLIAGNKIMPFLHNTIIGLSLLWIAAIITVISAVDYIVSNISHIANKKTD